MIEKLYFVTKQSANERLFRLQIFTIDGKEFIGFPSFYDGILLIEERDQNGVISTFIEPSHVTVARILWE